MVYDHINNLHKYLLPDIAEKIGDFLHDLPTEDGKYHLDGEKLYAMISTYHPRDFESAHYESHFKYTDLQIMIEGEESIYYHPVNQLKMKEINEKQDIAFYQQTNSGHAFPIDRQMFTLLYPQDGHLPSVGEKGEKKLRKVVFKII